MRMFTVKVGTDIEVKSSESDHFIMLRAQQDMHFFREDIYVDPLGGLTQDRSLQPLGDDGYYVFRSDGIDVKVYSGSVEVM